MDGPTQVRCRVGFGEALGDEPHLRLRRLQSYAVAQAADHEIAVIAAIGDLGGCGCKGQKHVYCRRVLHGAGEHANDGVLVLIELNLLADDAGVCTEVTFPKAVVDHSDSIAAGLALAFVEDAAEESLRAENTEEGGGDEIGADLCGITRARECVIRTLKCGEIFERAVLATEVVEVGEGDGLFAALLLFREDHDVVKRGNGERAKNDGIHAAEDCDIDADADGERGDDGEGKAGRFAKLAGRVAYVPPNTGEGQTRIEGGNALPGAG
jgi:hypothetical protein